MVANWPAHNSEVPVFKTSDIAVMMEQGIGRLDVGSGSTTFAVTEDRPTAEALQAKYHEQFGQAGWTATVSLDCSEKSVARLIHSLASAWMNC